MDEIGNDGLFRHAIPVPTAVRVIFVIAGLFIIVIATWELHRGVWPLNFASPFFLFLILGAWSVGGPVALAGLTGPASLWIVGPGRIVIENKRPFVTLRQDVFEAVDAPRFDVVEKDSMEGESTWVVALVAPDGRRFETRHLQTRAAAERLRGRITSAFAPAEPLEPSAG